MTPYEIEILIHYHCCGSDWQGPSKGNELYTATINNFIDDGLLERTGMTVPELKSTKRNECYVDGLTAVRLPIWGIPKG